MNNFWVTASQHKLVYGQNEAANRNSARGCMRFNRARNGSDIFGNLASPKNILWLSEARTFPHIQVHIANRKLCTRMYADIHSLAVVCIDVYIHKGFSNKICRCCVVSDKLFIVGESPDNKLKIRKVNLIIMQDCQSQRKSFCLSPCSYRFACLTVHSSTRPTD